MSPLGQEEVLTAEPLTPRLFQAGHVAPMTRSLRMKVGRQERSRDNPSDLGQDPHQHWPCLRSLRTVRPTPRSRILSTEETTPGARDAPSPPALFSVWEGETSRPGCDWTLSSTFTNRDNTDYEEVITNNSVQRELVPLYSDASFRARYEPSHPSYVQHLRGQGIRS